MSNKLKYAKALLVPFGVSVNPTGAGDYAVRLNGEAYFTEDLDDAVTTGMHMAAQLEARLRRTFGDSLGLVS